MNNNNNNNNNNNTVVYYHAHCRDGFAAAVAAWMKFGDDAEYIALDYKKDQPTALSVAGKDVFVLDYSFSPELLYPLAESAKSFVQLDHHISALEQWSVGMDDQSSITLDNGFVLFDTTKSGAMLAWEYFHPNTLIPQLIQFVNDYDLGMTFNGTARPETESYILRLSMEEKYLERWALLISIHGVILDDFRSSGLIKFISEGDLLVGMHNKTSENISSRDVTNISLCGIAGMAINGAQEHVNLVCHNMAVKCGTFGLAWTTDGVSVSVSIRSIGDCNVAKIATHYKGGGHKHAAGFKLSLAEFLPLLQGSSPN